MYKSKNELHIASKEIHFKYKDKNRTKLTRWKIIQHGNTNQRKSGQTLLISNKVDFRAKNITRGKESYFIVIKGSIHQEDTVILNIYAFNNRALKYLNKTSLNTASLSLPPACHTCLLNTQFLHQQPCFRASPPLPNSHSTANALQPFPSPF